MIRKLQNNVPTSGTVYRRRPGDGGAIGGARVGDVTLEQQRVTQIGGVLVEARGRLGSSRLVRALKRVVGDEPAADAMLRCATSSLMPGIGVVERARGDNAQQPGNLSRTSIVCAPLSGMPTN